MEPEPKTICDNCIHNAVCGDEGYLEPALKYCFDKISTDTLGAFVSKRELLLLSDIIPYLDGDWFTCIVKTGETCNKTTYTYPERFKVLGIWYCKEEQKLCINVEEIGQLKG